MGEAVHDKNTGISLEPFMLWSDYHYVKRRFENAKQGKDKEYEILIAQGKVEQTPVFSNLISKYSVKRVNTSLKETGSLSQGASEKVDLSQLIKNASKESSAEENTLHKKVRKLRDEIKAYQQRT